MNAPRDVSYEETVVAMLKADPDIADAYVATALEEAYLPGGQLAMLAALRHIAEAHGRSCRAGWYATRKPVSRPEPEGKSDHQDSAGRIGCC